MTTVLRVACFVSALTLLGACSDDSTATDADAAPSDGGSLDARGPDQGAPDADAPDASPPDTSDALDTGDMGDAREAVIDARAGSRTQHTLVVDGKTRLFTVIYPAHAARAEPLPAVLVLHGGRGNGAEYAADDDTTFSRYREGGYEDEGPNPVVFIYPSADLDPSAHPETWDRYWNDYRTESEREGTDDVAFLRALKAHLVENWPINAEAVALTGASNGGMMTMRVACEAHDDFASFVPVIANQPIEVRRDALCETFSVRRPMMFIHGENDRIMPYGGGEIFSIGDAGLGGFVESAAETVAMFRARAGSCAARETITVDNDAQDKTVLSVTNYECGEALIRHITIDGAGHNVPSTITMSTSADAGRRATREFDWLDSVVTFSGFDESADASN